MKNASPYKCNVCGKVKEESNHWWLLYIGTRTVFTLDRWDDLKAERTDVENICSESCASKALSKWMATQASKSKEGYPGQDAAWGQT